jgi:hypothetical protein
MEGYNHEEPDQVPLDLGGTLAMSINVGAYQKLRAFHGRDGPAKVLSLRSMIPEIDEEALASGTCPIGRKRGGICLED